MSEHKHDHHHSSHQHGGHHHHAPTSGIGVALLLNLSFAVIEAVGGYLSGSIAISTDAVHDFGDSLGLLFAFVMERLAKHGSSSRYSYGYRRLSLLSAMVTALVLIVGGAVMAAQAIPRLLNPTQPHPGGMFALALLGICVNGYAAWRLRQGQTMNERMVSWHMIEDVLGWAVILISSVVMMFVSIPILDPILSLIFVGVIMFGTLRTLRSTLRLFMQGAPESFDLKSMHADISGVQGVLGIHDVHLWSLDGANHVLTSHIVVAPETTLAQIEEMKKSIRSVVQQRGQVHLTLEIETNAQDCPAVFCVDAEGQTAP